MKLNLAKANGTQNHFLIIHSNEKIIHNKKTIVEIIDLSNKDRIDGVVILSDSKSVDFKMDYYNNDGTWETMCANGALCVLLVLEKNKFKFNKYQFIAGDGNHDIRYDKNNISIKMKSPQNKTGDLNIKCYAGAHIDSGAKHFVTYCDSQDTDELFKIAQDIRFDNYFAPNGLNVNFLIVNNPNHIRVTTYEKGIEEIMLSCGSGSVAAAYYASQKEKIHSPLKISNNGGDMILTFDTDWNNVWLTSNPTISFESQIDLETINLP